MPPIELLREAERDTRRVAEPLPSAGCDGIQIGPDILEPHPEELTGCRCSSRGANRRSLRRFMGALNPERSLRARASADHAGKGCTCSALKVISRRSAPKRRATGSAAMARYLPVAV